MKEASTASSLRRPWFDGANTTGLCQVQLGGRNGMENDGRVGRARMYWQSGKFTSGEAEREQVAALR